MMYLQMKINEIIMNEFCYERAQSSTETRVLEASLDFIESSAFLSSVHIVFASR